MKLSIPLLVGCSLFLATVVRAEDAGLDQAIRNLNAQAKTDADKQIVLAAVSQQAGVPAKTVQSQMATTRLNYGEILVADSLAEGTGKKLADIVALKKGKGWAEVSRELKVDPRSVLDRVRTTQKVVQGSQAKAKAAQAANAKNKNQAYNPNDPNVDRSRDNTRRSTPMTPTYMSGGGGRY